MGLIDSTQNISKEVQVMANVTQEKETKTELNARLERELEQYIGSYFAQRGSVAIFDFYNLEKREKVIQELGTCDYEYVRINKIYDKVLRRVAKIYENHQKYLDWNSHS